MTQQRNFSLGRAPLPKVPEPREAQPPPGRDFKVDSGKKKPGSPTGSTGDKRGARSWSSRPAPGSPCSLPNHLGCKNTAFLVLEGVMKSQGMLPGCGEGVGNLVPPRWDLPWPLSPKLEVWIPPGCWKNSGKASPALPAATGTSDPCKTRPKKCTFGVRGGSKKANRARN